MVRSGLALALAGAALLAGVAVAPLAEAKGEIHLTVSLTPDQPSAREVVAVTVRSWSDAGHHHRAVRCNERRHGVGGAVQLVDTKQRIAHWTGPPVRRKGVTTGATV